MMMVVAEGEGEGEGEGGDTYKLLDRQRRREKMRSAGRRGGLEGEVPGRRWLFFFFHGVSTPNFFLVRLGSGDTNLGQRG